MGELARWRLTVAYRGTAFHGFAAQPGMRTVAGDLAAALARLARLDTPPLIVCAGRTDAGVHASAQVIHVDLPSPLPEGREGPIGSPELLRSLNRQLGDDVAVVSAELVDSSFDARHSATWRRYRYLIHEAAAADPLLTGIAWHVAGPLDVRAMSQAIGCVVGSHDFRAFCRKVPGSSSDDPIVRLVTDAWVEALEPNGSVDLVGGRLVRVEIQASSFCHQMVRSLVAQVVEVGRGRSNAAEIMELLRSGSRQGAAQPAPPEGLCLIAVGYPESAGLPEGSIAPSM